MSQLPQDVDEFVAKHAYQDGHDRFSCRCVSVEALTDWMSGHVRVPVELLEQTLADVRARLMDAHNAAYLVCCGRSGGECCGSPEPEWPVYAMKIMDTLGPVERKLSALLNASKGE